MFEVIIDGTTVAQYTHHVYNGQSDICGRGPFKEYILQYYYSLTHSSSTIDIVMLSHLD
jgi:hypothetical protein